MLQQGSEEADDCIFLCDQHQKPIVCLNSNKEATGSNMFHCNDCIRIFDFDLSRRYQDQDRIKADLIREQLHIKKVYNECNHLDKFIILKNLITGFMNQVENKMNAINHDSIIIQQYEEIIQAKQFTKKVWLQANKLMNGTIQTTRLFRQYSQEVHENLRQIKNTIDQLFEQQNHYITHQQEVDHPVDIMPNWDNVTLMSRIYPLKLYYKPKVAFSADRLLMASFMENHNIQIRNVNNCELIATLVGHRYKIKTMAFSNDNQFLISAGCDSTTRIWNIQTQQAVIFESDLVVKVCYIPNTKQFLTQICYSQMIIWDAQNTIPVKQMVLGRDFVPDKSLAYSSDARLLLISNSEGYRLFNPRNWSLVKEANMIHSKNCYFSFDNKFIFVYTSWKRIRIQSLKPHKQISTLRINDSVRRKLSQSSNLKYIATTQEIINITNRKSTDLPIYPVDISFSQDGKSLIVVSQDQIQTFDTSRQA